MALLVAHHFYMPVKDVYDLTLEQFEMYYYFAEKQRGELAGAAAASQVMPQQF